MKNYDEEKLKEEYTPKIKTNLDEAEKLDRKVKLPAQIFTYTFGIIGALILGIGMCLAMKVIGDGTTLALVFGIIIGIIGIVMVAANYPAYQKILKIRKEKYASTILVLLNKDENSSNI
jgi:uncharacterized membrane protein YuzA (DUF378 family)